MVKFLITKKKYRWNNKPHVIVAELKSDTDYYKKKYGIFNVPFPTYGPLLHKIGSIKKIEVKWSMFCGDVRKEVRVIREPVNKYYVSIKTKKEEINRQMKEVVENETKEKTREERRKACKCKEKCKAEFLGTCECKVDDNE